MNKGKFKKINEQKSKAQKKIEKTLKNDPQFQTIETELKALPSIRVTLNEKDIIAYNLAKFKKGVDEINNYFKTIGRPELPDLSENIFFRRTAENCYLIVKNGNGLLSGVAIISPFGENSSVLSYSLNCLFSKETFKKFFRFVSEYLKGFNDKKIIISVKERPAYLALTEMNFKKLSFQDISEEDCVTNKENLKHLFQCGAVFESDIDSLSSTDLNITTEKIFMD